MWYILLQFVNLMVEACPKRRKSCAVLITLEQYSLAIQHFEDISSESSHPQRRIGARDVRISSHAGVAGNIKEEYAFPLK